MYVLSYILYFYFLIKFLLFNTYILFLKRFTFQQFFHVAILKIYLRCDSKSKSFECLQARDQSSNSCENHGFSRKAVGNSSRRCLLKSSSPACSVLSWKIIFVLRQSPTFSPPPCAEENSEVNLKVVQNCAARSCVTNVNL